MLNKIESFDFVKDYLKNRQVVYIIEGKQVTRFHMVNGLVSVHTPNAHFNLNLQKFQDLYGQCAFYLYDSQQDTIDPAKDDEYYAWKSKNAN